MTSTPRASLALPPPVARYFAPDTLDADARCFRDDAVVIDEQRTHRGRAAIARWKAAASEQYHYTSEPLTQETAGDETIVTARVTGDFPGSPVTLRFHFTLASEAIARLEITA